MSEEAPEEWTNADINFEAVTLGTNITLECMVRESTIDITNMNSQITTSRSNCIVGYVKSTYNKNDLTVLSMADDLVFHETSRRGTIRLIKDCSIISILDRPVVGRYVVSFDFNAQTVNNFRVIGIITKIHKRSVA